MQIVLMQHRQVAAIPNLTSVNPRHVPIVAECIIWYRSMNPLHLVRRRIDTSCALAEILKEAENFLTKLI
jgi:hypothetical protein